MKELFITYFYVKANIWGIGTVVRTSAEKCSIREIELELQKRNPDLDGLNIINVMPNQLEF